MKNSPPITEVSALSESDVWKALGEIADPEIPVLSLVDLKIVRGFTMNGNALTVFITPTFLGCPALEHMKSEIRTKMGDLGFERVDVELQLSPSWSTDMLDEAAKEKLRVFGIAPPLHRMAPSQPISCPSCGSSSTHMDSPFGPTLCRQIFYCNECRQSFERFKTI